MRLKSTAALCTAAAIVATFAAVAADDKFPKLDMQKHCTSRSKSSESLTGDKTMTAGLFEQCMKAEKEAGDAIAAAWKDIPQNYRSLCIRPNDFSPSYVEWIACLEMNIDVKKLRAN